MHMKIQIGLEQQPLHENVKNELKKFIQGQEDSNYFQSYEFYALTLEASDFQPVLIMALLDGQIIGSLLGVIQTNGKGIKSYLSRRLIIWGGPLVHHDFKDQDLVFSKLIDALKEFASGHAIYIEFRNMSNLKDQHHLFNDAGFTYRDHLNYLVKTDDLEAVRKRVSKSRYRQIKTSLKNGATIEEAQSEQDIVDFYSILQDLYRTKVKKPIPSMNLFLKFWKSNSAKCFLVKKENEVIGGIVCPVHKETIYEWYVCGLDNKYKGINPSVLATWAPIEWAAQNKLKTFDFMGAGSPEQDYGVRTFKSRFGGEEVCYGRYHYVVNRALFEMGKVGLKLYQKIA